MQKSLCKNCGEEKVPWNYKEGSNTNTTSLVYPCVFYYNKDNITKGNIFMQLISLVKKKIICLIYNS